MDTPTEHQVSISVNIYVFGGLHEALIRERFHYLYQCHIRYQVSISVNIYVFGGLHEALIRERFHYLYQCHIRS
jgi:hypothetical protein